MGRSLVGLALIAGIAAGDGGLWRDILVDNRDNLRSSIEQLRNQLDDLLTRWIAARPADEVLADDTTRPLPPATTTRPVVSRLSHATRPMGSSVRMASRIASEIWSAILSGWPSVTDSDVNV